MAMKISQLEYQLKCLLLMACNTIHKDSSVFSLNGSNGYI